jgi:polyhydroxyalkanoate synthesis regulator phasin
LPSLVTVPFKELDLFAGDSGLSARIQTSLRDLYIGCSQLPEKQYFLSIPAKKLCQDLISRLRRLNNETDDPGWNTIYPKIQGYLCRFILWIHLTNSVLAGNLNPDQMIDRQCVASAGKLVKFYLDQHLLLRALFTPEQKIEGDYLKIKDYLDRKACKKSVREIKAGVKGLRGLNTAEIKKMCDQMVNWGVLGIDEKTYYSVDFVDQNQQNVDLFGKKINSPQNHTQQGVQDFEKNQNVDFVDLLLTKDQKAESHTQQGLKAIKNSQNVDFVDPTPKNFQSPLVDHPDPTPVLIIDPTPDNSIFWGRSTNDDQNVPQNHTQQGVDPDTKRSTKSTFENYQNSETFDGQGFAANQDFLEKVNKGQQRSTNEGQKYQIGDRVICYPTMEHESNDFKVKATIISIEYEQGYILTCTVSYKNRKKEDRTAVICGGKSDWLLRKV